VITELAAAPVHVIREATLSDRAEIEAMHARCSETSRRYRWRAPLPAIPEAYLQDALRGRTGHLCLLAVEADDVIGFASAVEESGGSWQLGVLVRDDRQRRGIGTQLVARLVAQVRAAGAAVLVAETAPDRFLLLQRLARCGPLSVRRTADGLRGAISLSGGTNS
jgi:GNAT superfamily N-acetyltransferase